MISTCCENIDIVLNIGSDCMALLTHASPMRRFLFIHVRSASVNGDPGTKKLKVSPPAPVLVIGCLRICCSHVREQAQDTEVRPCERLVDAEEWSVGVSRPCCELKPRLARTTRVFEGALTVLAALAITSRSLGRHSTAVSIDVNTAPEKSARSLRHSAANARNMSRVIRRSLCISNVSDISPYTYAVRTYARYFGYPLWALRAWFLALFSSSSANFWSFRGRLEA